VVRVVVFAVIVLHQWMTNGWDGDRLTICQESQQKQQQQQQQHLVQNSILPHKPNGIIASFTNAENMKEPAMIWCSTYRTGSHSWGDNKAHKNYIHHGWPPWGRQIFY
jgi:hypothetical protein